MKPSAAPASAPTNNPITPLARNDVNRPLLAISWWVASTSASFTVAANEPPEQAKDGPDQHSRLGPGNPALRLGHGDFTALATPHRIRRQFRFNVDLLAGDARADEILDGA